MQGEGERAVFWRRGPLIALAVGLPVAEGLVLGVLRIPSGLGLAAQATALGPFGVFHDLRWLFVFHDSVATFMLGMLGLVVFRSLLVALLVRAAWPGKPPSMRVLTANAAAATLAAVVLLSPWVTLLFGASVVPLSWVYFAALPSALFTILLIHHGGIDRNWWRRLPPARSAAWVGLSFLVLSLVGLAVAGRSATAALPVLAAAGVFNAWAWHYGARSIVLRLPAPRRRLAPVTLMAAVAVLVMVIVASGIGFAALGDEDPGGRSPAGWDGAGKAVLVAAGFASGCCDDVAALQASSPGLVVEQFSYVGLDAAGRPRPHSGNATDADLERMAVLMSVQVEALQRRSGQPVAVVAESEGTLVAAAYLNAFPEASVDRLMLLSPIVEPARVTYPDTGEDGPGIVAGYQLRALTALIDAMAPFVISVDGPLADSLRRQADDLHRTSLCDHPGIEEVAVLPLADAVTGRVGGEYPIDVVVVPGFHGGLRGRADVQEMIRDWVVGGDLSGSQAWAVMERLIAGSASAWHVPALGPFAESEGSVEGCLTED